MANSRRNYKICIVVVLVCFVVICALMDIRVDERHYYLSPWNRDERTDETTIKGKDKHMEWREVTPEQDDWEKQINITAYYEEHVLGSIVFGVALEGWQSLIDGKLEYLEAETEEEAKKEMKMVLENHFESERNYYIELLDMLSDLH